MSPTTLYPEGIRAASTRLTPGEERYAAGAPISIILTNNVVPPSHIVSKATERKVPMLLVPYDTYETAKRIDSIEPLLTKDEKHKIELLGKLIQMNVDIQKIV